VVCHIKMEGKFKKITLESQLLFANNLKIPIDLFAKTTTQKEPLPENRIHLESGEVFRVPLRWILESDPLSFFLQGRSMNYQVLQDFAEIFTCEETVQKLSQAHSQILAVQDDYYASMDI